MSSLLSLIPSGRALCRHLVSLGVPVQNIVRRQETGNYVADFFELDLVGPTAPAKEWAEKIRGALPSARIIGTHDTIASWRPGQPTIYATVIFQLTEFSDDTAS